MSLVQDISLKLLTSSPAGYYCTTDPPHPHPHTHTHSPLGTLPLQCVNTVVLNMYHEFLMPYLWPRLLGLVLYGCLSEQDNMMTLNGKDVLVMFTYSLLASYNVFNKGDSFKTV